MKKMKQGNPMIINKLPSRTWNRLDMNEAVLESVDLDGEGRAVIETGSRTKMFGKSRESAALFSSKEISSGLGKDMDLLMENAGISSVRLNACPNEDRTIRIHLEYGDRERQGNRLMIEAEEGSRMTVFMDADSCMDAGGVAAVQTRIRAQKGACVRLVQLFLLGEDYMCLNDISGTAEEGADIEILQLFLGYRTVYSGCQIRLDGKASRMVAEIGYEGRKGQGLDMNYAALHKGEKTESRIDAKGVLWDGAKKLLRQTIDFQTGCRGANGEEQEDALLLGEDVENKSIPLILCQEEDVQGSHGATLGQLDEQLLFYLCSRGMTLDEAAQMMARARIGSLCAKIKDEKTAGLAEAYIERRGGEQYGR